MHTGGGWRDDCPSCGRVRGGGPCRRGGGGNSTHLRRRVHRVDASCGRGREVRRRGARRRRVSQLRARGDCARRGRAAAPRGVRHVHRHGSRGACGACGEGGGSVGRHGPRHSTSQVVQQAPVGAAGLHDIQDGRVLVDDVCVGRRAGHQRVRGGARKAVVGGQAHRGVAGPVGRWGRIRWGARGRGSGSGRGRAPGGHGCHSVCRRPAVRAECRRSSCSSEILHRARDAIWPEDQTRHVPTVRRDARGKVIKKGHENVRRPRRRIEQIEGPFLPVPHEGRGPRSPQRANKRHHLDKSVVVQRTDDAGGRAAVRELGGWDSEEATAIRRRSRLVRTVCRWAGRRGSRRGVTARAARRRRGRDGCSWRAWGLVAKRGGLRG